MRLRTAVAAGLAGLAGLVAAGPAQAQQEIQVPLDLEGRIEVMDAQTASELGVFVDEYAGFREARLFVQSPDSVYVLEISMLRDGRVVRERVEMSEAEGEALREDLSRRLAERGPSRRDLDQDGRVRLLAGSAVMSLGFYGWAVPFVLDVDDSSTAVGLYMLTTAAGFFVPWIATRDLAVTRGMSDLAIHGATRGIIHGLLFHHIVTGGGDAGGDPESDERGEVGAAFAFSLGEALAGYAWAEGAGMSLGTARTIGAGGDFGMLQGLAVGALADAEDEGLAAVVLAGGFGGIGAGRAVSTRRDYSAGDVAVLSTAGALGGYAGAAVVDLADPDEERWYAAGALAGNLAGLAVGDRLVRPVRFSEGQGRLVVLGTVAGGALGLGLTYLLLGDDPGGNASAAYLGASTLGAAGGFAVTFESLAPDAQDFGSGGGSGLDLRLNPAGLAAATPLGRRLGDPGVPVPFLTGTYRF